MNYFPEFLVWIRLSKFQSTFQSFIREIPLRVPFHRNVTSAATEFTFAEVSIVPLVKVGASCRIVQRRISVFTFHFIRRWRASPYIRRARRTLIIKLHPRRWNYEVLCQTYFSHVPNSFPSSSLFFIAPCRSRQVRIYSFTAIFSFFTFAKRFLYDNYHYYIIRRTLPSIFG